MSYALSTTIDQPFAVTVHATGDALTGNQDLNDVAAGARDRLTKTLDAVTSLATR